MAKRKKKPAKKSAVAGLSEEARLNEQLRTIVFEAVRVAKETAIYVAVPIPTKLLMKLLAIDEQRRRETESN
jgi:hypothetical protein